MNRTRVQRSACRISENVPLDRGKKRLPPVGQTSFKEKMVLDQGGIGGKRFRMQLATLFLSVLVVASSGDYCFADGFADKLVRFDGKLSKGKLDDNKNLKFFGLGRWRTPISVEFSPYFRAHFELVPFIETEAHGILGAYTVTFTIVPKKRGVSHQNMRVRILNRQGSEIESSGVAARNGSGWVIGISTDQQPFNIHISYSPEKLRRLTPVSSGESNPS